MPTPSVPRALITQFSIVDALLAGLFDGVVTRGEVDAHGDFGLGCGDHMDGELVILDGVHRLFRGDGSVGVLGPEEVIAFAEVARFAPDHVDAVADVASLDALLGAVHLRIPSRNVFVGIRLRGRIDQLTLRQPLAQVKPYQRLTDAMRDQHEVRLHAAEGTLVGFLGPQPFQGISVAGLHLHFVDSAGGVGGHVLAATGVSGELALEQYGGITVRLPESPDYLGADLDDPSTADAAIRAVESETSHTDQKEASPRR
ncbi:MULTISPECIES: acetolactate decarboxylase [unclassified Rathayibacter]|uniref:acetolactate decarboxylase n=1 Tax=unclassified Rathayibacter TaxID=2609250 RepID=UPI00188AFC5B|nr:MULTISPECIES: acetolactate decarboxylase [unclassified Rathayibacter]MBF4462280.1 acetolactate decarboxylase [Rathayibacter sp. VKM Ac-2879]MBF4503677.1 acetolactate decarboxylase [Rathayibacter sp. VKM Ac-2878]